MIGTVVLGYFVVINVVAFAFFGLDKMLALGKHWRIPEKTLWILALLGGSVGALFGMNVFRHKTKKTSFQFVLAGIIVLHISIILFLWYFWGNEKDFLNVISVSK